MKCIWMLVIALLMGFGLVNGEITDDAIAQKRQKLEQCLERCWGVDSHTVAFLCRYFQRALESADGHKLIDDFVEKSARLELQFCVDKELPRLSPCDGVILASKFHPVVFENPFVRIMAGCAEPGEREPFHAHAWRSLLVVFEEANYLIEYANGMIESLHLPVGVYVLPPEDLYACTNVGVKPENCLRFEVKE